MGRKVTQPTPRNGATALCWRISHFLDCHQVTGALGVAVSGGSDSIAMLHLMAELAPFCGLRLTVLHFNHGLRGTESDGDEAFVKAQADSLRLPFVCGRAEAAPNSNLEAWARKQRLAFFANEKSRLRFDWVATGHTRDDQAETVMMRILRGAGGSGLAGILPITREGLVRPLLELTRLELREYLTERGIAWREDRTNSEAGFADRNRVRLDLLPRLRLEWNPNLDQALSQLADLTQAEEEYWEAEVAHLLPKNLIFEVADMRRLPLAVRRRLMRAAIACAKGNLLQIGFQHVERALAVFDRPTGNGRALLPGGVVVERSFGQVRVSTAGLPDLSANASEVSWRLVDQNSRPMDAYNRRAYYLDPGKVALPLALQYWQAGKAFCIAGPRGSKKIKDLFQEARVPCWERANWPMLVSGSTVVWTRDFGVAAGLEATAGLPAVIEVEDFGKPGRKLESKYGPLASMVVG